MAGVSGVSAVQTQPFGGAFKGAYDPFAASIVHAYEPARRVLTSYTGNLVRLRRASDNAEANFTYLGNGNLNTAAIAAWAGGASYVVTVYDQAPAGDDVTQAVAANQPLYVAAGQNGHPTMRLDGTNDYLQGAYTVGGALSQPFNAFAVAQLDAAAVNDNVFRHMLDGDDAAGEMVVGKNSTPAPDVWGIYAGIAWVDGAVADANWKLWSVLPNGAASQFWLNTVSQAIGNAGAENADGLTIGFNYLFSAGTSWFGDVASVVICDPSLSDAQRVLMQNAMNAYWGVF